MNLYSQERPFEEQDEEIGWGFGSRASVVVENARAFAHATALAEQLQLALLSRDVIGQAKGIIRAREGCSPEEAFERLRMISQHRNVKLRDVARSLVEDPDRVLGPRARRRR